MISPLWSLAFSLSGKITLAPEAQPNQDVVGLIYLLFYVSEQVAPALPYNDYNVLQN